MKDGRRLLIPDEVPEDFAQAVATILLFGVAGDDLWDSIYGYPAEKSLAWIKRILGANDSAGLVHADLDWWEYQVRGH